MGFANTAASKFLSVLDRLVPKTDSVVMRTFPDLSDQGCELVDAFVRRSGRTPVWLIDGPIGPAFDSIPCRTVRTTSLAGIVAFLRARVVVHTHGVFGGERFSSSKRFVNIWHGMPVKQLERDGTVGLHQTDVTIATAPVHAEHLAETWQLSIDQVALTGLPRNDVLAREPGPMEPWLAALTAGRPLVVWLPTFRSTAIGTPRQDGDDIGTVTQFEGADLETIDAVMRDLGAHCLIKPHPLAPQPEGSSLPNVTVISEVELRSVNETTLYNVLAHADVLVTDHSSVWIDFLLTRRPILFTISDLDAYSESRGFYFSNLEEVLPGPVVTDMAQLRSALESVLGDDDRWTAEREAALAMHHSNVDANSADRVADLVLRELAELG